MDFFVVPTIRFQLLYVWFAIDHGRRRILHFNVTAHPLALWVIQQLRHAFPDEPTHRFLIFDNDAIFSAEVERSIAGFGIRPRRTALGSPWQNGTAERFDPLFTKAFRETLESSGVRPVKLPSRSPNLNAYAERFVRSIKSEWEYVEHYHSERNHQGIGNRLIDPPAGELRRVGSIECRERLGGLLRYYRRAA